MRRARTAALASAALLFSCASDGAPAQRELAAVWREYLALPAQRALAIAGDPRHDRWVTGASAGLESLERAEAVALAECRSRRAASRMQAECVLYARGDEIVWRGH